ncbi:MAG: aminotransferase class I/II-fold pyridoxal phosphate-dependent enzyme [Candidatus Scalinduaceae bacterium]
MNLEIVPSKRVQSIGAYAFAEVDKEVEKLKEKGIEPIDFGVGDPTTPTPEIVREGTKKGIEERKCSGYPSYIGAPEFRETICKWTKRRFGVTLDPATEVSSTLGSKEGIFNFAEGFVNPGDYVIIPTPGYPPYARGTLFAEGVPFFIPLLPKNNFLPDLSSIPKDVCKKTKLMWINYPNSPSGVTASIDFLKKIVAFGQENDIIIVSDEAYIDIYFNEPPHSILEITTDGVVAVHSMSKRSAMTCYRVGWIAGDRRIVDIFKKVKTNIDSGTATFIQDGAIASLNDEAHVQVMRKEYKIKRDLLVKALTSVGLTDCTPDATIYIWQKVPSQMSSLDFAIKLLEPEVAIVTTPGQWISDESYDGHNPGEGFVRFALVPSIKQTEKAANRISKMKF